MDMSYGWEFVNNFSDQKMSHFFSCLDMEIICTDRGKAEQVHSVPAVDDVTQAKTMTMVLVLLKKMLRIDSFDKFAFIDYR